jgi:3-deoxy-manno-octulosonate cytidylyltransferase (CMP-KDO synthetase)
MTALAVIPARWKSTRFPGKPLADIAGRPMIAWVWDQAKKAKTIDRVVLATDDDKIADYCRTHDMEVVMTSPDHQTGSDRLAEVARKVKADIYVNVQGDEPLIEPEAIDTVTRCLMDALKRGIEVSTGYVEKAEDNELDNPSVGHLVPTVDGCVMAMSRFPIPFPMAEKMQRTRHVGLYAFTGAALQRYATWERGPVERAESIELLRFLEHGERVACVPVPPGSIGVDHPADAERVAAIIRARQK